MNRSEILENLLKKLWKGYYQRVSYAREYADLVEEQGGNVQNDHIALRTFNTTTGSQPAGVEAISRIIEPLGYERKDKYDFTTKKLTAWHWEHQENPDNPKIFISQLEVDQISDEIASLIKETVADTHDPLTSTDMELLSALDNGDTLDVESAEILIESLVSSFFRPWGAPRRSVIEKVNEESQYAAWTLLHGNSVNHFTAYINKQDVKAWPDLVTTVEGLKAAGLPMKDEIEGEVGSKLRQSSTKAVMEICDVIEDDGNTGKIEWSYAYYELAERGFVQDDNGNEVLFSGFLGEQATHLFEMTKKE